jgi:hypothetical protein
LIQKTGDFCISTQNPCISAKEPHIVAKCPLKQVFTLTCPLKQTKIPPQKEITVLVQKLATFSHEEPYIFAKEPHNSTKEL